jgi:hypothetical protein
MLLQGAFEGAVAKRVANGKEIICLSSDNSGLVSQLVMGMRDGTVQVYTVSAIGEISVIFSVMLEDVVPISVSFTDNTAKDVIVIGMYCGQKYVALSALPLFAVINMIY